MKIGELEAFKVVVVIREVLKKWQRTIKDIDFFDIIVLSGIGCIGYGLYLIFEPMMFMFVGFSLILIGMQGSAEKGSK